MINEWIKIVFIATLISFFLSLYSKPHIVKTPSIREIQVSAVGEQRLNPDQVKLVVVVTSQKETVEEVKASVTRREEYILQVKWDILLVRQ